MMLINSAMIQKGARLIFASNRRLAGDDDIIDQMRSIIAGETKLTD